MPADQLRDQLQTALAGRYAIERELGRGGMATVYLARDVKHQRLVAVKVLDPELGAVLGGERFLSEIRVTANLQHPNLLPLFDSGAAEGLLFYVMPFVEGESLRARLDRERQLPVAEAVRLTSAIAGALDYAHRRGVVHRDLKPENVLLHDAQPVVADFGIALAVSNAGGQRVTQTGLSLGTPQYMSPEQATGDRVIDGRTDIYSLGAVCYEMLTGEPPHTGATAQAVIARLMTETPRPVGAARPTVPPHVAAAVETALAKLPADRFATAAAFGEALEDRGARFAGRGARNGQAVRAHRAPRTAHRLLPWALAAVALGAATLAIWQATRVRAAAVPPLMRFVLALPPSALAAGGVGPMALASDGSALAYAARGAAGIFVRRLADLTPTPVPGTAGGTSPQFSPDGEWLAFVARNTLKRVPLAGGSPVVIADSVSRYAWGERGTIVFAKGGGVLSSARSRGLWQVRDEGGAPTPLTVPDSAGESGSHTDPSFVPGGEAVVFTIDIGLSGTTNRALAAARLADGKVIPLGIAGRTPRVVGDLLLYTASDGALAAAPFDATGLKVTGRPTTLMAERSVWTVSPNGTLLYLPSGEGFDLTEVDHRGANPRVVIPERRAYFFPRYSPDGRRIVVTIGQPPFETDLWVFDTASRTLAPLTNDRGHTVGEWTPDGKRFAWTAVGPRAGVHWQPWDGSAPRERLLALARGVDFLPAGDRFLSTVPNAAGRYEPRVIPLPVDTSRWSAAISVPEGGVLMSKLSPDGRWLAYVSDRSGTREVYVQPMPGPGGRFPISVGGGIEPRWSRDGRTLFYRSGPTLVAAAVELGAEARVLSRDTVLAQVQFPPGTVSANYDISPDGRRVLFPRFTGDDAPVLVIGWLDAMRERLVAARGR